MDNLNIAMAEPLSNNDEVLRNRNIAADAYTQALKYLEKEFDNNPKALTWLQTAASTSLSDVLEAAQTAEAKYNQMLPKQSVKSCVRGLSKRIMYYGQVLDILSQHHPEYVSLVWGSIKFVLMGIINHENLVTQFCKALRWIAQALPRCEVSAELYQTDEMKDAIASLYAHILLFLQKAIKWFNVGPAGRALTALFKPFELGYKDTVDQIMICSKTIDDISRLASKVEIRQIKLLLQGENKRAEERERKIHEMQTNFNVAQVELSAAVGTILQIVTRDTARLEQVRLDVEDMKPRVMDIHFNQILGVLKPKRSPEDALQKHKSLIRRSSPWRNQNRDTVEVLQTVGEWVSAPRSSLLVLQTQPRAQARVKQIATELIGVLQPKSDKVIWYLSNTNFEDQGVVSATEVLRCLVFQSMKLAPELVTSETGNFTTAKLHASHSEGEWLNLLYYILRRLKTCFLIVEAEDVFKDKEQAKQLVEVFLKLQCYLQDTETVIKLLVVNYGDVWPDTVLPEGQQGKILVVNREAPVPVPRRRLGSRAVIRGNLAFKR